MKTYRGAEVSSSSLMAPQSNADLRLLNGLLPVISSIDLTVPRSHLKLPNCWLFPGWGRSPTPNPQTGGPGLHIYILWRLGGPVIPPRHRVPVLVAFYDMHGLQWYYSFPRSLHGDLLHFINLIFIKHYKLWLLLRNVSMLLLSYVLVFSLEFRFQTPLNLSHGLQRFELELLY
jgi:hypothetical protein